MFRLRTVRAKLTSLVSLSVLATLVAFPVLSWSLHRQLVDEVDDRVTDAEKAFGQELNDDLADLTLASRVLAADERTARALASGDRDQARRLAQTIGEAYPDMDVLLADVQGRVVAQVGCERPPEDLAAIAELSSASRATTFRGVIEHGCETGLPEAPPAYVIFAPVAAQGYVVVCLPLDVAYLRNSSAKLGVELGFALLRDHRAQHGLAGSTAQFPSAGAAVASHDTTLIDTGDRSWAVARFEPPQLVGRAGPVAVLAALDVTDIQLIVRRNLGWALAAVTLASALSIALGSRVASVISNAVQRVSVALRRVEKLDYVHVELVRTGDELEQLAIGFNRMVDGLKERDKLRSTFGKYMTETVMEHLLSGKVALGGETLRVTILFTDIRGFTAISERMDPHELVSLLNEYFTEMVGIVMQEDGVIDKYIGDALMAVFGAPVPKPADAVRAVRAAARMRVALSALNVRLEARGIPGLRTGIGIHTGDVVAGNIGSEKRMEYTVIGDSVNLASRLETSTKELGVDVLVSEDTFALTQHVARFRPMREIVVKGRQQPVMTYELLGLKNDDRSDAS